MMSWTLSRLRSLEPDEHDFQEFKSSAWLVTERGEQHSDFLHHLSKQVSAFVNGAGGHLFIGVNDDGTLDEGVPIDLKKGGVRSWLEDVVMKSVTPSLSHFNVYEVQGEEDLGFVGPRIAHAVYVLELPSSRDAPHQARDHRYYLRIAGKSRPMSHLHIEDVLRRNTTPRVCLSKVGPYGELEKDTSDPRGPQVFVLLRAFIHNQGRSMAKHVGVELTLSRSLIGKKVRERMAAAGETHYTQRPGEVSFFRYHPTPLFPSQEVYGLCQWLSVHANNIAQLKAGATLNWTVYADDARPISGEQELITFPAVRQAIEWVEQPDNQKLKTEEL